MLDAACLLVLEERETDLNETSAAAVVLVLADLLNWTPTLFLGTLIDLAWDFMPWEALEATRFRPALTKDCLAVFCFLEACELATPFDLRLVPVLSGLTVDFSLESFPFGLGPRTPRQDGVPQRHSWTFLLE